jgi:hypothetical protein
VKLQLLTEEGTLLEVWDLRGINFKERPMTVTFIVDEIAAEIEAGTAKEVAEAAAAKLLDLKLARRAEQKEARKNEVEIRNGGVGAETVSE